MKSCISIIMEKESQSRVKQESGVAAGPVAAGQWADCWGVMGGRREVIQALAAPSYPAPQPAL